MLALATSLTLAPAGLAQNGGPLAYRPGIDVLDYAITLDLPDSCKDRPVDAEAQTRPFVLDEVVRRDVRDRDRRRLGIPTAHLLGCNTTENGD